MQLNLINHFLSDPLIAYAWKHPDSKGKIEEFHSNLPSDKSKLFYQIGDILYTSHQNLYWVFQEYKKDCILVCETGDSGLYEDKDGDLIVSPVVCPIRIQHTIKEIPSNFKHIFITNYSGSFSKWPQITPLPYGVQKHQLEQIKQLANSGYIDLIKRNLLYVNFQTETNPIRRPVNRYWSQQSFPWAKVNFNVRNNLESNASCFLNYSWIAQSKFTLCPEGNGLDSYRIWESLYLGAIPIVKNLKTYNHPEYLKMPLFKTNDMTEMKVVPEELLQFNPGQVDLSFLTRTYWNNKIKAALNIGNHKS